MTFLLFFFFNLFILISSYGYFCPKKAVIYPPPDISQPYYYPETWNDTQVPPVFHSSQRCNWEISVPDGMYAVANFYKYAPISYAGVGYSNMNWAQLSDNDTNPFSFTSPNFTIELRAVANEGQFAFKIRWYYYPSEICKDNIQLADSELVPVSDTNCATTFTALNRVRLIGFGQVDMTMTNLRLSAVYEGDSVNGVYCGNLYDAYTTGILSQGKQLTVYTFGWELAEYNHPLFLGMDEKAAGAVQQFRGLDCSSYRTTPCYMYPTSNGVSAMITASSNVDYIREAQYLEYNCTLKIYEGQINDNHLLVSVNTSNAYTIFPMAVKNTVKIYVTNGPCYAILDLPWSRKPDLVYYSRVYDGRYVNIRSFDVGQLSYNQDTFENFTTGISATLMNFNFNVSYTDLSGPSTLQISIFRKETAVFNAMYTTDNPPPSTTFKVLGDSMTVNYHTYTTQTKGFKVELLVTEKDGTSTVIPPTTTSTTNSKLNSVTSAPMTSMVSELTTETRTTDSTTAKTETTTKGAFGNYSELTFLMFGLNIFSMYFFEF